MTVRLRRVYGPEEAGRLLGDVSARTVTARAQTVERASGGAKVVIWPRASQVNPTGVAYVWADWVEGLAQFEGHPNPGDVAWQIVALPDLPGMPAAADVTVLGAPPVDGVDQVAGSIATDREKLELVARVHDAEAVADSARTEAAVHEVARLQAQLDAEASRADQLAAQLADVVADRNRFRDAVALLAASTT